MYLAEIHGKFSPREERMEDILTSNVFSFFNYSSRHIFLKNYLKSLDLDVSAKEAEESEFIFWPHYKGGTEPDLVLIAGKYYILFEAKYHSGFGEKTETSDEQLIREIKGGQLEAKNFQKEFLLFAITADYYYKKEKFKSIPQKYQSCIRWTNWQLVSFVLERILETNTGIKSEEQIFTSDLCQLLDKKSRNNGVRSQHLT
jgi:Holliday junction resolvase